MVVKQLNGLSANHSLNAVSHCFIFLKCPSLCVCVCEVGGVCWDLRDSSQNTLIRLKILTEQRLDTFVI